MIYCRRIFLSKLRGHYPRSQRWRGSCPMAGGFYFGVGGGGANLQGCPNPPTAKFIFLLGFWSLCFIIQKIYVFLEEKTSEIRSGIARISLRRGSNFQGPKFNPSKNRKVTGFDPLFLKGAILTKYKKTDQKGPNFQGTQRNSHPKSKNLPVLSPYF